MQLALTTDNARAFAIGAHGLQKYGDKPYVFHLDQSVVEVNHILELPAFRFHDKNLLRCATYLHDVVEDADIDADFLAFNFGTPLAELVFAVTDGAGANRTEKKKAMFEKVLAIGEAAIAVKLGDRFANVKQCVAENDKGKLGMYRKEQPIFQTTLYTFELEPVWRKLNRILGLGE